MSEHNSSDTESESHNGSWQLVSDNSSLSSAVLVGLSDADTSENESTKEQEDDEQSETDTDSSSGTESSYSLFLLSPANEKTEDEKLAARFAQLLETPRARVPDKEEKQEEEEEEPLTEELRYLRFLQDHFNAQDQTGQTREIIEQGVRPVIDSSSQRSIVPQQHEDGSSLSWAVDRTRPAQSLVGRTADQINRKLRANSPAFHSAVLMLLREQEYHATHIVFYHVFSHSLLLYEVHAEIARALYGASDDLPPLPRIRKAAFNARPCLDMLLEDFPRLESDHHPSFRALAICASMSLFGGFTEAPPIHCFDTGTEYVGANQPNYAELLRSLLRTLGAEDEAQVNVIFENILAVAQRHQLPTSVYHGRAETLSFSGSYSAPGILQIFVAKEWADTLAYPSHSFGHPIRGVPVTEMVQGEDEIVSGQARLFMIPESTLDDTKVKMFYTPNLFHQRKEHKKDNSRRNLILDIRAALSPLLNSPAARARARRGVEGELDPSICI